MKRLPRLGFLAAACLVLAACGGTTNPPRDGGPDPVVTDDGAPDEGILVPDDGSEPDHTRDLFQPDEMIVDEGVTDDGVDVPDVPPVDVEVPGDVPPESDETPDVPPADTCVGPACVPCEDDGLICTTEEHDPETGECVAVLLPDYCLVDGACWFTLQPSPTNQCLFCVPSRATDDFSPNAGLPCEDDSLCTSGDTCDGIGACVPGPATDCDDDNPCTLDRCDARLGCQYTNYDSTCDDHDACTYLDRCQNRKCSGTPINCNDFKDCTADSCEPAFGCLNVNTGLACDDGNACTSGDACVDKECAGTRIDCDDGNPCTSDSCADGPAGGCVHKIDFSLACSDENACTTNDHCSRPDPLGPVFCEGYARTCNDANPCTQDSCDDATGCVYTPYVPDVNPCAASADPCVEAPECIDGACVGVPKDCEDGNLCTIDSCDALFGCQHVPTSGACDDHNACTTGETCGTGSCSGGMKTDCNDHNDCTTDDCLPDVGCLHTPRSGACQDVDPCSLTGFGTCEAGVCKSLVKDCAEQPADNPCTLDSCDANGNCIHAINVGGACAGSNLCVVGQACSAAGECVGGGAKDCNDHNVCTIDACMANLGCVYTPTPGTCDDRSKCTQNDQCEAGVCVGQPIICEDSNYCTENQCDPATGCFYPPISRPCDDSNPCTLDDQCVGGACVGLSKFEDPSDKTGKLSLGLSGNPGQGVDVDGLETTCSPKGNCVKGIDNAFGVLSWLFNPEIIKANANGTLALLIEPEDPVSDGSTFVVNLFWGERIAPAACDPTTPGCNYGVSPGELQGVCEPVHVLDNATIVSGKLIAGGKDYTLPIYLVFGTHRIPLTLNWVKLVAAVSLGGGHVTGGAGAMGGIVTLQSVLDGVGAMPAADFPPPYTRDIVMQYLSLYLKPDFDADGDGTKESVSMGWPVTLVTAHIIGPL